MPGCIVSATTASFRSVEKRRRRATPVITSTFENVSDIGVCLGLYLGPPAKAGVRSKQGAVHQTRKSGRFSNLFGHKNRHTPVRWTARREYHVPNVSMAETTSRTVSNLNLCRQECLA